MMRDENESQSTTAQYGQRIVMALVVVLLLIIVLGIMSPSILHVIRAVRTSQADATHPELVLQRAEDAVSAAELVLAFLEGASVLLALGVGAAAFVGFRQAGRVQDELERLQVFRSEIDRHLPLLEHLGELKQETHDSIESLHQLIDSTTLLLQADMEFRLENHQSAYEFVEAVLKDNPDNPLALYMGGWLETHHVESDDKGLSKLGRLIEMHPDWPSALAGYGVALRRDARRLSERGAPKAHVDSAYYHALSCLHRALVKDNALTDVNRESYWGPIGGIYRELGNPKEAKAAYESALKVTPGSSYPQGNIAALSLHDAKADASAEESALRAFKDTVQYATVELSTRPNSYYLIMDLAMAKTILGHLDSASLQDAAVQFEQALAMAQSPGPLGVSLRGWKFLLDGLPERDGWEAVRAQIESAIAQIESRQTALEQA